MYLFGRYCYDPQEASSRLVMVKLIFFLVVVGAARLLVQQNVFTTGKPKFEHILSNREEKKSIRECGKDFKREGTISIMDGRMEKAEGGI